LLSEPRASVPGARTQTPDMATAAAPARPLRLPAVPGWADQLVIAFAIYVTVGVAWMLTGAGGPKVTFYVGLFYKQPAAIACILVAAATARRMAAGPLRSAWWSLAVALALYFIADCIGFTYWLEGRDPFPGPADILYCAFYLPLAAAALWLIRAAAMRVPWVQLSLDATIFVVGFGAFFWFLVVQPAAIHAPLGFLKEALSEAYLALDSFCLLLFGVLLLAGAGSTINGWRIPLLLLAGFAAMFLGDIIWS